MLLIVLVFAIGILVAAGLECQERAEVWFAGSVTFFESVNTWTE